MKMDYAYACLDCGYMTNSKKRIVTHVYDRKIPCKFSEDVRSKITEKQIQNMNEIVMERIRSRDENIILCSCNSAFQMTFKDAKTNKIVTQYEALKPGNLIVLT